MMRLIFVTTLAFVAVFISGTGISRANADEVSTSASSLDSYGSDSSDLGPLSSSLLPVEVREATTVDGQQPKLTKTTKIMLAAIAAVALAVFTAGGWVASRSPAERQTFYQKYLPYMAEKPVTPPPIQIPIELAESVKILKESLKTFVDEIEAKKQTLKTAEEQLHKMQRDCHEPDAALAKVTDMTKQTVDFSSKFVERRTDVPDAVCNEPLEDKNFSKLVDYGTLLKDFPRQMKIVADKLEKSIVNKYAKHPLPKLEESHRTYLMELREVTKITNAITQFNDAVNKIDSMKKKP